MNAYHRADDVNGAHGYDRASDHGRRHDYVGAHVHERAHEYAYARSLMYAGDSGDCNYAHAHDAHAGHVYAVRVHEHVCAYD